jgi:hypothetical protein
MELVTDGSFSVDTLTAKSLQSDSVSSKVLTVSDSADIRGKLTASIGEFAELSSNSSMEVGGDLSLQSLTVEGLLTASGGIVSAGDVVMYQGLTVSGPLSVESSLVVSGMASVASFDNVVTSSVLTESLEVRGPGSLNSITVGSLNVTGASTVSTLTADSLLVKTSVEVGVNLTTPVLTSTTAVFDDVYITTSAICFGPAQFEDYVTMMFLNITDDLSVGGNSSLAYTTVSDGLGISGGLVVSSGDVVTVNGGAIVSNGPMSTSSTLTVGEDLRVNGMSVLNATSTRSLTSQSLTTDTLKCDGTASVDTLDVAGDSSSFLGQLLNGPLNISALEVGTLVVRSSLVSEGTLSAATVESASLSTTFLSVSKTSLLTGPVTCNSTLETEQLAVQSGLIVNGVSNFGPISTSGLISALSGIDCYGDFIIASGGISASGSISTNSSLSVLGTSSLNALNVGTNITSNGIISTYVTIKTAPTKVVT